MKTWIVSTTVTPGKFDFCQAEDRNEARLFARDMFECRYFEATARRFPELDGCEELTDAVIFIQAGYPVNCLWCQRELVPGDSAARVVEGEVYHKNCLPENRGFFRQVRRLFSF
mgnify:CR=1 FL=1